MPLKSAREIETEIDAALHRCSLRAAGFWVRIRYVIENTCFEQAGELIVNGLPLDRDQLASLIGCAVDEANSCLSELAFSGLLKWNGDAFISRPLAKIFSVRESQRRRTRKSIQGKRTNFLMLGADSI